MGWDRVVEEVRREGAEEGGRGKEGGGEAGERGVRGVVRRAGGRGGCEGGGGRGRGELERHPEFLCPCLGLRAHPPVSGKCPLGNVYLYGDGCLHVPFKPLWFLTRHWPFGYLFTEMIGSC